MFSGSGSDSGQRISEGCSRWISARTWLKISFAGQFRHGKFTGGNISVSDPGMVVEDEDRGQVVIAFVLQQGGFHHGPGRDDPDDLSRDQTIFLLIRDLFADGDMITFVDQA